MAKNKESVKSPSNSKEGLVSNCGGQPPKWDVAKTFTENVAPKQMAKDSTVGLGGNTGK